MERCRSIGFQLFQGQYFAKPEIVSGRRLSASQASLIRVSNLAGRDADTLIGKHIPLESSRSAAAFRHGEVVATDTPTPLLESAEEFGPELTLPLRANGSVTGVLTSVFPAGASRLGESDQALMTTYADQAAVALQLADTQRRMRELDVYADRDRIARGLHDHVIQRLFAVGLSLQGTMQRARSTDVRDRRDETIDDIQAIVQDIRFSGLG